jgi:FAD/FMN-containing dehydrogenase
MSPESRRTRTLPWHELAATLRGKLLPPDDTDYETRRRVWNGAIDRHPPAIAQCLDAEDVAAAVKFAARERVPMTVRGGGHNVAGLAVRDDALMLDLGAMNRVDVDASSRIARVEGGALWQDVDAATQPHGLATTGGFVSTTGVGGYTLGGGVGWLMRSCGLAIDNLLEAEVVLPEGRVVTASEQQHPDLFWGLRGGGGGLGVVTRFTCRLHPVGEVQAGVVFYRLDAAHALLRAFRAFTPDAADALTAMLVFTTAPPLPFLPAEAHGQRAVALAYCWNGDPAQGAHAAASITGVAEPWGRHEGVMPYAAWQQAFNPAAPPGHHYYWTTSQFDAFDDALIDALVVRAANPADPLSEVHVHHLGGAVARVASGATAFSQRDATFFINVIGHTDAAERFAAVRDWVRDLRAALAPHARTDMQPNFAGEPADLKSQTHDADTRVRLSALRARYDPDELLTPLRTS